MPKYVLGISAFYHDAAAAILRDGEIIAAAQEERFTRKKYDSSFPKNAIDYCLREAKIGDVKKNFNFSVSRYSTNTTLPMPQALFIHPHSIRPLYL